MIGIIASFLTHGETLCVLALASRSMNAAVQLRYKFLCNSQGLLGESQPDKQVKRMIELQKFASVIGKAISRR